VGHGLTLVLIERVSHEAGPAWRLAAPGGASALVLEHGAQVFSWHARGRERLFLSPHAGEGLHVRGGIPISFPQFDRLGSGPRHGFARLTRWRVDGADEDAGGCSLRLSLDSCAARYESWRYPFRLEVTIALGHNQFAVDLTVRNTGIQPFSFSCALHAYVACENLSSISLEGLQGLTYRETTAPSSEHCHDNPLVVEAKVGRIYPALHTPITLRECGRELAVSGHGFPDVVIWNPHEEGCRVLDDMPPGAWRHFLCVEAACALTPLVLPTGEAWQSGQILVARA
jgi:glucose-6-phosphate 1-epimerase